MISFTYNKLRANALQKELFTSKNDLTKARAGAIHDTTKALRTLASKEIRKSLLLKKKAVDGKIQRFFKSQYSGGIRIKTRSAISLSQLTKKAKQRDIGVTYELRRGQTTIVRSAFGPKITKLHGSVYTRVGKARKPIAIKQYTDLAQDLYSQGVVTRLNQEANKILRAKLKRRINLMRLRQIGKVK